MQDTVAKIALAASVSLLCGCDNIAPSAESMAPTVERVMQESLIQVATDAASGDQLICVGALSEGPCTPSSAEAIVSGAAKPETVTARWAGKGKIIVNVGSGNLEKSSRTAMDGKVTIEYQ